ncbi:hypothetical protein OPV22_011326 [Ensete ventricosum]|uniref:Uncharacterized protein n=1 Tax=Ensete ventricosum TaxID=4639 RepID=A0AAV8RL38_ENSVE|nr:hypothetical protein OPV22_011326 [Ensete ventricosum]
MSANRGWWKTVKVRATIVGPTRGRHVQRFTRPSTVTYHSSPASSPFSPLLWDPPVFWAIFKALNRSRLLSLSSPFRIEQSTVGHLFSSSIHPDFVARLTPII